MRYCVPVPEHVTDARAVVAPLLATALHSVRRGRHPWGGRSCVAGAGLLGNLIAQLLAVDGPTLVIDPDRRRLETAAACRLPTLCERIEACDPSDPRLEGVRAIYLACDWRSPSMATVCHRFFSTEPDGQRRGVLVTVGRGPLQFDASPGLGNVDTRVASRCGFGYRDDRYATGQTAGHWLEEPSTSDQLQAAMDLIARGAVIVDPLITHAVGLDAAGKAYDLLSLAGSGAIGVVLNYLEE